jgi:type I restriction enzyme S subunit
MPTVELSRVAEVQMGTAPSGTSYNSTGEGVPLIAGAGDYGNRYPCSKKWTTEATRLTKPGDLIVCVRATIGDLNWADREYCLGRGVAGIRPDPAKLNTNYLAQYLAFSKAALAKLGTGSTFPAIRRADLDTFPIPLPPLSEQKRIAEILDRAEALQAKRRHALALLDELTQSIFLDMFGDPVTNPKGVQVVKLAEVTTRITDGVHQKPNYTDAGVAFISVKDITTGKLMFDCCKFISAEDHQRFTRRSRPERLDILYTKVGATYGRPAIIETDREFSIYVSVCLIKPNKELINPFYLSAALGSSAVKKQADSRIKGIGVPDLHLDQIQKFLIPLPTMEDQQRFSRRVKSVEKLKSEYNSAIVELDALFASLQHRAFRGEL